jgi:hypothetical protein
MRLSEASNAKPYSPLEWQSPAPITSKTRGCSGAMMRSGPAGTDRGDRKLADKMAALVAVAKRGGGMMDIQEQHQQNPVEDEVLALTAAVRPILRGTLFALKQEMVEEAGGYQGLKLKMLPRLYKAGDGDCGICFEYAVHEAIMRQDGRVLDKIVDATRLCNNLTGQTSPTSLLFGLEKKGTAAY